MIEESRIAVLEAKYERLLSGFNELRSIAEETAADHSMILAAVLSLVETHPQPDLLGPVLRQQLAQVESMSVFQSLREEYIEAAQASQASILSALANAEHRGS